MAFKFENSLRVGPERPVVIDYRKMQQGQIMPIMHYHPYYEIYILVEGRRKYFFQNRIIELYPRDVLIIKPNDPHRAIPIDEDSVYERHIVNVDPTLFLQIERYNRQISDIFKKGVLNLEDDAFSRALNIIESVKTEQTKDSKKYMYSIRNHIERLLLEVALNGRKIVRKNQFRKNDIRIQEAIDYILDNYNQNITVDMCAKKCHMGKSNFTKVFHDVIGTNYKEYLNSIRIKKACSCLLETDMSISEISECVGYDTPSYFASVFKKKMNISPKDYRNINVYPDDFNSNG